MKRYKEEKLLVIVSGATGDIGSAIVKKMIESGYFVLATGRNKSIGNYLVSQFGVESIEFVEADLLDKNSLDTIFSNNVFKRYILDSIILCAGILKSDYILDVNERDWNETMEINVNSTFRFAQKGLEILHKTGKGTIVVIGSRWGESGAKRAIAYSTSKSALRGMIKSMQLELKDTSIRAVLISPGSVAGKMSKSIDSKSFNSFIKPEDVAETVLLVTKAPRIISFGEISIKSSSYDL